MLQRPLGLHLATLAAMLAVAACGGGDGGSPEQPPTPTPTSTPVPNRAPVFTSPSSVSVAENVTGTIYTATATDADSNPVTFSLAGTDAGAFRLSGDGALSFAAPPDFEAPTDADGNNVYLLQLTASDGTATSQLSLSVTVTNAGSDAFRVRRVATGLSQPLFVAPVPGGSGRIFVVERTGRIRILSPASGAIAAQPFLDVSAEIATDGERGLLGFATAPDFANSGIFYVYMTNRAGTNEVRRYRALAADRDRADPASGDVILAVPHPGASNHNGGWIGFGPDGFLYVGSGDGGGAGDPARNAQNNAVLLGKMLRLDVASDAFPGDPLRDYAIPAGQSVRDIRRRARNLGARPAQSVPQQLRSGDGKPADRRCRPKRARRDRPDAAERRGGKFRLVAGRGNAPVQRPAGAGLRAAGDRI